MEHVVVPMLMVLVALSLVTVLLVGLLWWQHNGLAARVAAIESTQKHLLNHADARMIFERLSSMEGQVNTLSQLTRSVQQHLLDKEKK